MYKDSLTEAVNKSGDLFGVCKLKNSIQESDWNADANELGQQLIKSVEEFASNIPFKADFTLLFIQVE